MRQAISFHEATAEELLSSEDAIRWLSIAAEGFGGVTSMNKIIDTMANDTGIVIFCKNEIKLRGAVYITFTVQEIGMVMSVVLLGGIGFHAWKEKFRHFLYKLFDERKCDAFFYMGRPGFQRIYTELKEIGRVYTWKPGQF